MRLTLITLATASAVLTAFCGVSGASAAPENLGIRLDVSDPLQKTVQKFLEKNKGEKLGLVIGRGNVQGIAEERIAIDSLKRLEWLFVDPGDTLRDRFINNDQDESLGNALKTTWPLSFSLQGQFDAVVFDYGTLQYIGDDGTKLRLTAESEFYKAKQQLRVKFNEQTMKSYVEDGGASYPFVVPESGVIDKDVIYPPCRFNRWLVQNNPPELVRLTAEHSPKREREKQELDAANLRQLEVLKRGLRDAYVSLKPGGVLYIPIGETLSKVNLLEVLGGVDPACLFKGTIPSDKDLKESPILPQNTQGMGAIYSNFYAVTKAR